MKIIIWDSIRYGLRYYSESCRWVLDPSKAKKFQDPETIVRRLNVSVGLILTYDADTLDLVR